MILVYLVSVAFLGLLTLTYRRRANKLASKLAASNKEVSQLVTVSSETDPLTRARQQHRLGGVLQQNDVLESRHKKARDRYEYLASWQDWTRKLRGRKAPYVVGCLDTAGLLVVLDHVGVSISSWVGPVVTFFNTL